jgi:ankyrin repeat protein
MACNHYIGLQKKASLKFRNLIADPRIDAWGKTRIHILQLLVLDGRFDILDCNNRRRESVFHIAASFGHESMVSYLLGLPYIDPNAAEQVHYIARLGT